MVVHVFVSVQLASYYLPYNYSYRKLYDCIHVVLVVFLQTYVATIISASAYVAVP